MHRGCALLGAAAFFVASAGWSGLRAQDAPSAIDGDDLALRPTALGPGDSAGRVAKRQGATSAPPTRGASAPGPFILAPGIAATLTYTQESAANPYG